MHAARLIVLILLISVDCFLIFPIFPTCLQYPPIDLAAGSAAHQNVSRRLSKAGIGLSPDLVKRQKQWLPSVPCGSMWIMRIMWIMWRCVAVFDEFFLSQRTMWIIISSEDFANLL
jgi:hypothetical protein